MSVHTQQIFHYNWWQNYFCRSGFNHGKTGFFHQLSKSCQPCIQ